MWRGMNVHSLCNQVCCQGISCEDSVILEKNMVEVRVNACEVTLSHSELGLRQEVVTGFVRLCRLMCGKSRAFRQVLSLFCGCAANVRA